MSHQTADPAGRDPWPTRITGLDEAAKLDLVMADPERFVAQCRRELVETADAEARARLARSAAAQEAARRNWPWWRRALYWLGV